jgi:hypothetical protein
VCNFFFEDSIFLTKQKTRSLFMKTIFSTMLVASLTGVLIHPIHANAASISFTPTGSQIDSDPIYDLIVSPGQVISFDINADTNNINTTSLTSVLIEFSITLDTNELELVGTPSGGQLTATGFRSIPGVFQPIPQNSINKLTSFQVRAKQKLPNDGSPDVTIAILGAFIGGVPPTPGAEDVTSSFVVGGANDAGRILSVQTHEPTSILSLLAIGTLGAASTLKRKLKPS